MASGLSWMATRSYLARLTTQLADWPLTPLL